MTKSDIVSYWEQEGLLFAVPENLKEKVALALEEKAKNVRDGKDIKTSVEDFEDLVNKLLDMEFNKGDI